MSEPVLQSDLTCPECGRVKRETMPQEACQFFYEYESAKCGRVPPRATAARSARSVR